MRMEVVGDVAHVAVDPVSPKLGGDDLGECASMCSRSSAGGSVPCARHTTIGVAQIVHSAIQQMSSSWNHGEIRAASHRSRRSAPNSWPRGGRPRAPPMARPGAVAPAAGQTRAMATSPSEGSVEGPSGRAPGLPDTRVGARACWCCTEWWGLNDVLPGRLRPPRRRRLRGPRPRPRRRRSHHRRPGGSRALAGASPTPTSPPTWCSPTRPSCATWPSRPPDPSACAAGRWAPRGPCGWRPGTRAVGALSCLLRGAGGDRLDVRAPLRATSPSTTSSSTSTTGSWIEATLHLRRPPGRRATTTPAPTTGSSEDRPDPRPGRRLARLGPHRRVPARAPRRGPTSATDSVAPCRRPAAPAARSRLRSPCLPPRSSQAAGRRWRDRADHDPGRRHHHGAEAGHHPLGPGQSRLPHARGRHRRVHGRRRDRKAAMSQIADRAAVVGIYRTPRSRSTAAAARSPATRPSPPRLRVPSGRRGLLRSVPRSGAIGWVVSDAMYQPLSSETS